MEEWEYDVSIEDGYSGPSPVGSPGPSPADVPFGADISVATAARAQSHTSVAVAPDGSILVAYTNETSATNRDVYVARSTNGGQKWTHIGVATSASYNEFDPRVVRHGSLMYIFFGHDDPANTRAFRRAISSNNGGTWAVAAIPITNAPFRDYVKPDASSYQGTYMYVKYQMYCDVAASCGGIAQNTLMTVAYDAAGAIVQNTVFYWAFAVGGQATDLIEPTIHVGPNWAWFAADASGAGFGFPGERIAFLIGDQVGQLTFDRGAFFGPVNTDNWRLDGAGYDTNFAFAFQYIDAGAGTPNHIIATLYSANEGADDDGDTFPDFDAFIAASDTGLELKDPAIFASKPLTHLTFNWAGNLGYTYSLDAGGSWVAPPYKVNGSTGTAIEAVRATDVTYAGGLRVVWADNRAGASDVYFSTLSGYAFTIFDRSPSQGTLNIGGTDYPVPVAFLWATGTPYTAIAPGTEPAGTDTQVVFDHWEPSMLPNPTLIGSSGSSDTVITASYRTQYFLRMSASVGTVFPGDSWHDAGATVTIQWSAPAPGPGERFTFCGWTGSGPGSYTGMSNPVDVFMNGPITEIVCATREWQVTLDTTPTGLQLTIDGTNFATPQQRWWVEGSSHPVTAISPQQLGNPLERYVFSQWADGALTPTRTITATAATTYTAQYNLEYQVTIASIPTGRTVEVDGAPAATPLTFWWRQNSVHLLNAPSPQTVGADTRYVYQSWSDGGAQSHTAQATGPLSLTANFVTENRYVIDTAPVSGLQITVDSVTLAAPQTYWWVAGSTHIVQFPADQMAGPDSRRQFLQWSDLNTANPRTFTSGTTPPGAHTIQTFMEHRFRFDTVPAGVGIVITVNTNPITTPGFAWLREGTTATVAAPSPSADPVNPAGIRYMWQSWSNAGTQTQSVAVSAPQTLIATYRTQYFLTVTTPYANKIGETWYDSGTTAFAGVDADIDPAGAGTRNVFAQWDDDASGTLFSQSNGIMMNGPKTATAVWQTQYQLTVLSTYGTATQSNPSGWYNAGTTATVTVSPLIASGPPDTRYKFGGWTGPGVTGGATTGISDPIPMDAPKTATAGWTTQYFITVDLGGQAGIMASCLAPFTDCWADQGSNTATVALDLPGVETTPGQTRIGFIRWTGAAAGTNYAASNAFLVDGSKTVTVEWRTQHFLALVGDDPSLSGTSAVTQSGSPGNDGWFTENSPATLVVTGTVQNALLVGQQWVFGSWSGGATGIGTTVIVTMDGPKTVTLTWQHQVRLTILSSPALSGLAVTITADGNSVPYDPSGVWVDFGATVVVRVPGEATSGGQGYKFERWAGGGPATTSLTIPAVAPLTLTAQYRPTSVFESPALWGGLIAAIVAALLIAFLLLRKRRKEPGEPTPPATAGAVAPTAAPPPPGEVAAGTMDCPSCGMTIPAVSGQCPICGAEVTAPAAPAKDERVVKLEEAYKSGRINKEQYQANLRRLRNT